MPKLTLISHDLCPYVQRAVIALAEKGVAFDRVYIDLAAKPDWFLAISPLGKVPLLKVGDDVIFESAVILEYLEETQPHPLLSGRSAGARAPSGDDRVGIGDPVRYLGAGNRADARGGGAKIAALTAEVRAARAGSGRRALVRRRSVRSGRRSLRAGVPLFRSVRSHSRSRNFRAHAEGHAAGGRRLLRVPSIRDAVVTDYAERLERFVAKQNGYLAALLTKRAA